MQAKETRLQEIIEGTKQYVIPLFQRSYNWQTNNWSVLWKDISELADMENPRVHFMGSIVNMPTTSVPHGVAKYLLIDGQQRLTTILIILALIRNKARAEGNSRLADKIHNTLLINQYEDGNDKYKLLPTQMDRKAFIDVVDDGASTDSQIRAAYNYFEKQLRDNPIDLDKMLKIITDSFSVVSIVLDADDNPYLVFESLNAKGRPLTQADLIKNYFFMRIHVDKQEEIYETYWMPMQSTLGENMPEFIRHYMMKDGGIIRVTDVYYSLKDKVNEVNAIEYIQELNKYSKFYNCFINPRSEENEALRNCFSRINRIEATTAYPVLLYFYGEYCNGGITLDEFVSVLTTLENYLIRRFICDYKTNLLNKIFPSATPYIKSYKLGTQAEAFRAFLSERSYPRDSEFKIKFKETKMYGGGDRKAKTKLILESLEQSYHHKEIIDTSNLTIEHIMPQTLSEWWQNNLGENWEDVHQEMLDTIGNLTLTAYNSELSNDNFDSKKDIYAQSPLEMNKYLSGIDAWNKEQILKRAEMLAEKAIEIWPSFGDEDGTSDQDGSITGSSPYCIELLGETFSVKTWRDVFELTLNTIYELEPEKFEIISDMLSKYIGKDMNKFRAVRKLKNGYFIEVNLSATTIFKNCLAAIKVVGLTSKDWTVKYNTASGNVKSTKLESADLAFDFGENETILREYDNREDAPSKYSLNGSEFMKANVFAYHVVSEYVKLHPEATFKELQAVFPDPKNEGSYGVIRSLEYIKEKNYKGIRYFMEPEEILKSADNIEFAVSTEWSWHNTPELAVRARELGFIVTALNRNKNN